MYKANSTTTANPITPIKVGEDLIINVNVERNMTLEANITGFVKATINGTDYYGEISNGAAVINVTGLASGNYTNIVVTYLGNNYYNESSTKVNFTVNPTDNYNITVKVADIKYGENATIEVILPMDATGNVTVYVDGRPGVEVPIVNGIATLANVSDLDSGRHIVNVTYKGNSIYAAKDKNNTNFTVNPTDDWVLEITVEAHKYGDDTIFTVTLPENVDKNVTLTIEGHNYPVNLTNGHGSLSLNNITPGMHTVVASYEVDARYAGKTNSTNFYVDKLNATVSIVVDENIIEVDNNITFTVTTNSNATLIVKVNGVNATHLTGNRYTFNATASGNYTIIAEVLENDYYNKAFNSSAFNATKHNSSVNITVEKASYVIGSDFEIGIQNNTVVNVTVNGKSYNVTNGKVDIDTTNLAAGKYIVIATIFENGKYYGNITTKTFNITKSSKCQCNNQKH